MNARFSHNWCKMKSHSTTISTRSNNKINAGETMSFANTAATVQPVFYLRISKKQTLHLQWLFNLTNSHREGVATRSDRLSFLGRPIIRSLFSTTSPVTLTTNARKQPKCGMEVFVPFQQQGVLGKTLITKTIY